MSQASQRSGQDIMIADIIFSLKYIIVLLEAKYIVISNMDDALMNLQGRLMRKLEKVSTLHHFQV